MNPISRRQLLTGSLAGLTGVVAAPCLKSLPAIGPDTPPDARPGKLSFGLVTYQWGKDWDLPRLIENCQTARVEGVELRTTHAHGVEPSLGMGSRLEVRQRFRDSSVALAGLGSDERFDHPDPERLKRAIEACKTFLQLSHDVDATGVKVKPNSFHPNVPREQTILQIGRALNAVGKFGAELGQQVRLEVHGQCAELPTIKAIMDVADHPNVGVCWNSNAQDLHGKGLKHNFSLVRARFGDTVHVRELDSAGYPFGSLIELLVQSNYRGWVLLEASSRPNDRVAALAAQAQRFERLVAAARAAVRRER